MKELNRFCFLSVLLVVLIGFLSASAQVDYATATLRGSVMDPQGAVIAGATVTVINPSTGITKTVKTDGDGAYRVPALPPGTYQITIDGGENEYGTGQYRVTTVPQDTIQEYQVNRNAFAAEFGFTNGSAINIVTKSGGNRFHGTAYGYFQNHNTSATNFFNGIQSLPSAYSQSVYTGFTAGGPIAKDRLFFFFAYEYRRLDNPDFTNANVLTAPTVLGISAPGLAAGCSAGIAANQLCYLNALKASGNPFLVGFGNGITPGLSPLNNA